MPFLLDSTPQINAQSPNDGVGVMIMKPANVAQSTPVYTVSLRAHADSITEARILVLDTAVKSAFSRGIKGKPTIRAETFFEGSYSAIVDFIADEAPAIPKPVASEPLPAPETTVQPKIAQSLTEPSKTDYSQQGDATPSSEGKPSWIMVLPIEVGNDGKPVWGKGSTWSRTWLAPLRQNGLRFISVMGDADDRDKLTASMLYDISSEQTINAALSVGRKYGAPAVAIVKYDKGAVTAMVARQSGSQDSRSLVSADISSAHDSTVSALSDMFSSSPSVKDKTEQKLAVDIQPDGDQPEGIFGFSLVVESSNKDAVSAIRKAVSGIKGIVIRKIVADDDGMEITGSWLGTRDSFENALVLSGVPTNSRQ